MRAGLSGIVGDALLPSRGPILPMLIGEPEHAVRLSAALRERGFVVQAIRPPTVPKGTSRLRITAHAGLTDAEVEAFLDAVRAVWVIDGRK
jgi:8-amino-7-oxononanoate synthase